MTKHIEKLSAGLCDFRSKLSRSFQILELGTCVEIHHLHSVVIIDLL